MSPAKLRRWSMLGGVSDGGQRESSSCSNVFFGAILDLVINVSVVLVPRVVYKYMNIFNT